MLHQSCCFIAFFPLSFASRRRLLRYLCSFLWICLTAAFAMPPQLAGRSPIPFKYRHVPWSTRDLLASSVAVGVHGSDRDKALAIIAHPICFLKGAPAPVRLPGYRAAGMPASLATRRPGLPRQLAAVAQTLLSELPKIKLENRSRDTSLGFDLDCFSRTPIRTSR